jgi:hypothetical protein
MGHPKLIFKKEEAEYESKRGDKNPQKRTERELVRHVRDVVTALANKCGPPIGPSARPTDNLQGIVH